MRVLFPLNSAEIGGGNRSLLTLWAGLRPLGIDAAAVAPGAGPMVEACREAAVPCATSDFAQPEWRRPLAAVRGLAGWRGLLRGHDLVHSNGLQAARSVALAARLAGIPHVCHVRFGAPESYLAWVFRGLPGPAAFVFNSEALRGEAGPALAHACPRAAQHVVHNAVDLGRFRPRPRPAGVAPRIGIVANLAPVKGHEDFLLMARDLADRGIPAELWIAGDDILGGGRAELLRRRAAELGLEGATRFLGHRADVAELMSELDVLVSASLEEPFGRVLIEAMACARPVVATAVGGVPEVVEDGVTGLLVPPAQPGRLADAVGRLLASPELRAAMGEAGRRRAAERFAHD
ncbi:MAG TPA: glycosyltransferase, partial [Planctomycetota bacterium]|nr:glycosyltransferase [Planctomycetota bacterium]